MVNPLATAKNPLSHFKEIKESCVRYVQPMGPGNQGELYVAGYTQRDHGRAHKLANEPLSACLEKLSQYGINAA